VGAETVNRRAQIKRTEFKKAEYRTRLRRVALRKIGKKGKENVRANRILAKNFTGHQYCEAKFPHDCTGREQLTWAHNMKRRKKPDLLRAALICVNAHNAVEFLPPEEMKRIVDEIVSSRETNIPEAA
jgi:hypothetical protein